MTYPLVGCGGTAHTHTASRGVSAAAPSSRQALATAIAEKLLPSAPAAYIACYLGEIETLSPTAFERLRAELTDPSLHKVPPDIETLDIGCIKDPATLRLARRNLAATIGGDARRRGLGVAYGACVSRVIAHLPLQRVRRILVARGGGPSTSFLAASMRRACGVPH